MEKEEKVREEKDVYTLVEEGEGERERDEKSAKNHRKNHRKTTKNRPKMNQKSILDNLGGALEAFGGQDQKNTKGPRTFGASWSYLGHVLGASRGRLGAWITVLGRLGAS